MNNKFEQIRQDGRLLYEYISGSHLYGLNVSTSDVDTRGVFMCTPNELLGSGNILTEVSDAKHDNTWYELRAYIRLLIKSNPNVLESLFAPSDKILGEVSPIMREILNNRQMFLSKDAFNPLVGYAYQQIHKARGLNKKIVNPMEKRLTPLDFCYTAYKQGSTKLVSYLQNRGLMHKYCGLIALPNMHNTYGLYYDFGAHIQNEGTDNLPFLNFCSLYLRGIKPYKESEVNYNNLNESLSNIPEVINKLNTMPVIGYRGILNENEDSTELRLSSIDNKNTEPICIFTYNESGYHKHCIDYKAYKDWEKNRNPVRYESNLNQNYDSKNMMHSVRLIHMGIELARDGEFNVCRTWDKDFLLKIRNHGMEYDELINYTEQKYNEFKQYIQTSTLPDHVDTEFVNNLLISTRKKQLGLN